MDLPLRIVNLEDDPLDTDLVLALLRKDGLAVEIDRVDTLSGFHEALRRDGYGLILADYSIPGMDALEALRLAREERPEVPFIFLSGAMGEETAIEMLKLGASDYVLKQRMGRLVPAVRRALQEAEEHARRKQAEEALRQSEERFKLSMEATNDGLWDWNAETDEVYYSPSYYRILDYEPGGFPGTLQAWKEMVHPEDLERVMRVNMDCVDGRSEDFAVEYRMKARTGEWRWILGRGRCIARDAQGRAVRLIGTHVDITARKRAEETLRESERFINSVAQASPHWFYVFDFDSMGLSYTNRSIFRDLGYPPSVQTTVTGLDAFREFMPPEELPHLARLIEEWQTLPDGLVRDDEYRLRHADGTLRYFAGREIVFSRHGDGRVRQILGLLLDITERKQAEEALRAVSAELQRTLDTAATGLTRCSRDLRYVSANPAYAKVAGLPVEQIIGRPLVDVMGEAAFEIIRPRVERVLKGEAVEYETELPYAASGKKLIHVVYTPDRDADGKVVGWVASVTDITERKRAEEELQRSELFYRQTLESIPGMVFTTRPDGYCDYQSQQWVDYTGVPMSEHVGDGWNKLLHPDDRPRAFAAWYAAVEGRAPYDLEYRVRRHDGQYEWFKVIGRPICDASGQIVRWFGVAANINELKRAEEALQEGEERLRQLNAGLITANVELRASRVAALNLMEDAVAAREETEQAGAALHASEQRYHTLFNTLIEGFCIIEVLFDADGRPSDYRFLEINPAFEAQTGLHDAQGKLMRELAPDHEALWFEIYGRIALTGEPAQFENESKALNRWYELSAYRVGGPESRKVAILFNDITERKRAESNQALMTGILRILNRGGGDLQVVLSEVLRLIRESTAFDAVGLRIRNGDDYPYYEHNGFSDEFMQEEKFLCVRGGDGAVVRNADGRITLECTCGLVLSGGTDPSMPCFTNNGSFWTNVSSELLALAPAADPRTNPRNRCIHAGYQSVGLFPVRAGEEILGLLQLNDRREGRFNPEFIGFVESLADNIGLALTRKQAEEALRKSTEELERSNRDLTQFASVASHDLQEPLRTVSGFVQLLQRKYANQLDAEAGTFIEYAVDGTKRMETLIRDLLAYARVGTRGREPVLIDAGSALRQALDNLHESIQETGAEITNGELPTVRADLLQLAQLFQNLIGNALKFRSEALPKIRVDACREGDCWRFSVSDNGIGIDPQFQDHVFEIFRRLHTHKQYAGTGIGLAICKKIVDRHGGQIWVESELGQGATFYFTIPT